MHPSIESKASEAPRCIDGIVKAPFSSRIAALCDLVTWFHNLNQRGAHLPIWNEVELFLINLIVKSGLGGSEVRLLQEMLCPPGVFMIDLY